MREVRELHATNGRRWPSSRTHFGRCYQRSMGWCLAACLICTFGCEKFHPQPLDKIGLEQRAKSNTDGNVTVSVAALSKEEARGVLGVDLDRKGIQPVWVKVENREAIPFLIPPIVMDHEYFSPMEAAWQAHG